MNPCSKDMQTYLNELNVCDSSSSSSGSASIGLSYPIYIYELPTSPTKVTMIRDTGGFDPLLPDYLRPTIQILVRGEKGCSTDAYTEISKIVSALSFKHNVYIGSTRYIGIWQMGDILWVGVDKGGCPIWSANFRLHRT